jgi:hypothetical protein
MYNGENGPIRPSASFVPETTNQIYIKFWVVEEEIAGRIH